MGLIGNLLGKDDKRSGDRHSGGIRDKINEKLHPSAPARTDEQHDNATPGEVAKALELVISACHDLSSGDSVGVGQTASRGLPMFL